MALSRKIVLIGDFSTGKTSLIRRFVENQFSDRYLSTIGVKLSKKRVVAGDTEVMLLIWDIEGGTPQKPLNTTYLRGAHGAIVVADISREETVSHLPMYLSVLKEHSGEIPFVIAFNKCDLIAPQRLEAFKSGANGWEETTYVPSGVHYVSAKTGEGVEAMFTQLTAETAKGD